MKLITGLLVAAAQAQNFENGVDSLADSAKIQNYELARNGEFGRYQYEQVPDGFEGSFQNFNSSAVIEENKDDEIFREFEVLYSYVDSSLGRKEYSDEQKAMIRKFKLVKNMIVYLQRIPLFGKFCFYGCYCFASGPFRLLENAGNGQPMDKVKLQVFFVFSKSTTKGRYRLQSTQPMSLLQQSGSRG